MVTGVNLGGWQENVGGIAQLVEHVLCKHEVTGSNPVASTSLRQGYGWQTSRDAAKWPGSLGMCFQGLVRKSYSVVGRVAQLVRARP